MAASWSASLVLRHRRQGGGLEIVQTLDDHDVGGGGAIEYLAHVEGPSWLAEFITEPPGAVADRFDSIDADEFLNAVAEVSPRLATVTSSLVRFLSGERLEAGEARPFLAALEKIVDGAIEDGLKFPRDSNEEPLLLSQAIIEAIEAASPAPNREARSRDWNEVFEDPPLSVLESCGFRVTPLFHCAADGMASGVWSLSRVHIGGLGYLVFDLPESSDYEGGALLVGWEPASGTAAYQAALEWAYKEYGQALSFPFTRSDIEVEMIRNERLFRSAATKALGGIPRRSRDDTE